MVEADNQEIEWSNFGWFENPFVDKPNPNSFVLNNFAVNVKDYISAEAVVNVCGPSGIGKTTLLKWLEINAPKDTKPIYIEFSGLLDTAKMNPAEDQYIRFISEIESAVGYGFLERITKQSLYKFLSRKLSGKKLLLLLNEADSVKIVEISEFLRAIRDEEKIKSSFVITSILPLSDIEIFKESFRKGRVFKLNIDSISFDEAKELLQKRIEMVGGKELPFDDDLMKYLYNSANGLPQVLLQSCSDVIIKNKGMANGGTLKLKDVVKDLGLEEKTEEIESSVKTVNINEQYEALSENHRKILDLLKGKEMTADELAKELNSSYASVAKELSRLMLKADKEMMIRKGLHVPVVGKTTSRPAKYHLTEAWERFHITK